MPHARRQVETDLDEPENIHRISSKTCHTIVSFIGSQANDASRLDEWHYARINEEGRRRHLFIYGGER